MRKYIMLFIALCLHGLARGQTQGFNYHYWFDDDPTILQHGTSETDNWQLQPDASGLSESLHAIHVVVRDEEGRQSLPMTRLFLRFKGLADQTEAYYWFDVHEGQPTKADVLNGTFDVDVSSLSEGLHAIYFLAQKRGGAVTTPQIRYFLKMPKDPSVVPLQGFYWFDNSAKPFGPISVSANTFDVDASSLSDGFHQFHYAVSQNGNAYSSPVSKFFLKASQVAEEDSLQGLYWFDESTKPYGPISVSANTFDVDASSLSDGFHQFHYAVSQGGSAYSSPVSKYFMKVAQVAEEDSLTCLCSVDGQLAHVEKLPCQGGIIHWDLDMYDIPDGIHRIQLMAITKSGAMCNSFNTYFIRATTSEELGQMRCLYAIDGSAFDADASIVGENGNYHFDLDLSALTDGLHSISYMLYNDRGTSTKVQTRFFIKTPEGGNGLGQYQYWLNDDSISQSKTVTLEKKTNPLQLMALLPVESHPLRSSQFHFEVDDGQPMMYAKNTIHLRFYDASMRFSDAAKEFVDYKIGQEVLPVGELQETQTFDRLAENDVRWYTMQLEFGDSIAFKSNMACSMQVFSPNGEEIYSTSGSQSTSFGGCHVFADGIYYMCIHDVTGTSQADIKLDYQKIDRYAILAYTPKSFGVPSTVNISLEGNGFLDGIKVYISKDETLIKANTLTIEDISHATANFIFDSIQLGKYDLRVVFAETDSITIDEAFSVEEGDSLPDIKIAIEGSPTFMSGSSASYNIRFTNRSNIPAFFMPFTLTIDCNGDISNLPYLKFETDLKQQIRQEMRIAFYDQCTPEELKNLEIAVFGDDDLSAFYLDTVSVQGKTYLVGDFILPRLDGHSTLTIPFTIKGVRTNLIFYAFADPHWSITELVNIARSNGGGNSGGGGSGSGGSGGGGSGGGSGGSGGGSGGSGGSGGGSGSGSGSGGSGGGSGGSGGGSGGSGGGSGGSGGGSGGSGGGSGGSGGGSGGSGGGSGGCKDPCALKMAIECFQSIVESIDVVGSVGEALRSCAGDLVQSRSTKVFSDYICDGKLPDLSNLQKNPKPVIMDITKEYAICLGKEAIKRVIGGRVFKTINIGINCLYKPLKSWANPCPDGDGGSASFNPTPVNSHEPNEIYGYVAESGSRAIREGQTDVFYTIQFENDTVFATAPAHDIYLTDTLDVNLFDLSTYRPTRIKIGEKSMELTGERNFISTMDMRPAINAIAQIEGTINDKNGIVRWHISSLDPMTMEPSDDPMVGVLPVNFDGSGLGEASFEISLKPNLPDGTIIPNRSGNVFDNNETVLTPTWTNIVDAVAPSSVIDNSWMVNDSTLRVTADAFDARSGVWKYEWYVQAGENAPWWKEGETESPQFDYHIFEGIDYGFCVLATDSAGNVEQKVIQCERGFKTYGQDFEDKIDEAPASAPDKEGAIYDLSGRRQAVPKDNQINIIDKKKVLFRRKN